MKIVIAGNYKQYKDYLRENNLTPQEARYISTPQQLRGLRDVEVIKVGEWWLNPCADDDYLKIIERPTKRARDAKPASRKTKKSKKVLRP